MLAWRPTIFRDRPSGKSNVKRGPVPATKLRSIVPLPTLLSIIDQHVAAKLHTIADHLESQVPFGFFEGAKSRRQVMDLIWPVSQVLEKGVDRKGHGCIAQMDIENTTTIFSPSGSPLS